MTQEVLKLALKCAERCDAIDGMYSWSATITAIKEALALTSTKCEVQPAQEHVAWMYNDDNELVPLFTAPPPRPWVGLTEAEFDDLQIENIDDPWANFKAIETKLKEKNT